MARTKRKINLSRLGQEEKRRTWAQIRQNNPALAELLQDSDFQTLRDHFDAEVSINAADMEVQPHGQH